MILRQIANKNEVIIYHFSGSLTNISYIGVSETFDSPIKIIRDKEKMRSFLRERIFGVLDYFRLGGTDIVDLYTLKDEEVQLLSFIEESICIPFKVDNIRFIYTHCGLDSKYWFLRTDKSFNIKYLSILEFLLSNEFDISDNCFFLYTGNSKYIRYKLNCSEKEFRLFLTKVRVLK